MLDVATDAELGFSRPQRATLNGVDRKTFLKTAFGAGAGALVGPRASSPVLDHGDLAAAISGPTAHYRRMESAVSSGQLSPAVEAHLRLASGIVADKMRTSTGFAVLSEISGLAAWLAVDRSDNATARKRYTEAISHAEQANHPLLAAYMTASLGYFAVEAGSARQGLSLLDKATGQLDKNAPDSARAWLASLHAVGHAALGDRTGTLVSLRAAEKWTSRQKGEPQWPWVFPFDRAKAARYQAGALGRLGDLRAASASYEAAVPTLIAPKARALAQLDHAQTLARAGLIAEAVELVVEALVVGRDFESERIISRVRDFRSGLPARTVEAVGLDAALAAFYEQEAP